MFSLFPFQADAKRQIAVGRARGRRRQVLALPTGAGKTIVSASEIADSLARGEPSLFLAPRRQVCDQTWKKLVDPETVGIAPELVSMVMGRDPRWRSAAPVSVACADSLAGRDLARAPRKIIVDECHLEMSTWLPVVQRWPDAEVIGLSATPGAGLGDYFEEIIAPITVAELIALGRLARFSYYTVPEQSQPDLRGLEFDRGDFEKRPLLKAVDKPSITGDAVEHWRRLAGGRLTLTFCIDIAHAEHTAAAFSAAGVPSACLHSKMSTAQRTETIAAFRRREITNLCSCDCLSEGFDAPEAKCALLLRPTESLEKFLQQVGRVLRWFGGETAVIIDPVGNYERHGLPSDPHVYELTGTRRVEKVPSLSTCPECLAVFDPAPECPACGFTRLPPPGRRLRKVGGELVLVTESRTMRKEPTEGQKRTSFFRQSFMFPGGRMMTPAQRLSYVDRKMREWREKRAAS